MHLQAVPSVCVSRYSLHACWYSSLRIPLSGIDSSQRWSANTQGAISNKRLNFEIYNKESVIPPNPTGIIHAFTRMPISLVAQIPLVGEDPQKNIAPTFFLVGLFNPKWNLI